MEDQTAQPPPGSSSAAYPRWVLLEPNCQKNVEGSSCSTPADVKTLASARTTSGYPIHVSLRLAEPPAASAVCLHLQIPDNVEARHATVAAAHGDSVLIQVTVIHDPRGYETATIDHFVYNAGAAAEPPRLPSLSMLPPYYITHDYSGRPQTRELFPRATGLIRRGEDELVVAELSLRPARKDSLELVMAELLLFRSGEWMLKRPRISYYGNQEEVEELPSWLHTDTVVPIGNHVLCWVSLSTGLLFCDVFEESPILQHVKLPMDPCYVEPSNRNVCVTDGGGALKLVDIFPRCCCGSKGATGCHRSHNAYVVNTWTLRMSGMEWVKDGMVDATELWALDAYKYKGLPRILLSHPVVSIDKPYVICFLMIGDNDRPYYGDQTVWVLMVDTRSKTIQSVSRYQGEGRWYSSDTLIPSNVSYYLNSSYRPTSSSDGMPKSNGQSQIDMESSPVQVRDVDASNSMLQSSCKLSAEPAVQASEILAALQEIPSYGLDRDDMLKAAYRILSHGNGHRFRSLLSLPKNLRKDWLLMEIKASED